MPGKDPNDTLNVKSSDEPLEIPNLGEKCSLIGLAVSVDELEVLSDFFKEIEFIPGISFVVVTHLTPSYSRLVNYLKGLNLSYSLLEVKNKVEIDPNNIYYSHNNKNLLIRENNLCAVEDHPIGGLNSPIDIFFNSLGYEWKELASGILLCGLGSDGFKGALSVKQNGGKLYVQDPLSIRPTATSISSSSLKLADKVLSPRGLAKEVVNSEKTKNVLVKKLEQEKLKVDLKLKSILKEIQGSFNVNFEYYKHSVVMRRIEKRMNAWRVPSLGAYYEVIMSSPKEKNALFEELLVSPTSFFKGKEVFDRIENYVLPNLISSKKEIRIWCIGCSTGEEAYSTGILFSEYIEKNKLNTNFKIFATDINQKALDKADAGIYSNDITTLVNPRRIKKFFKRVNNSYEVVEELKKKVVFAYHNIFIDPPFVNVDLILCINLLAYLKRDAQNIVLGNLGFSLDKFGFLVVGSNEKPIDVNTTFVKREGKQNIYSKIGDIGITNSSTDKLRKKSDRKHLNEFVLQQKMLEETGRKEEEFSTILLKHAPPAVFINNNFEILFAHGNIEGILNIPKGESYPNILSLLSYENGLIFRSGIRKAINNEKAIFNDVLIDKGTEFLKLNILFESCWLKTKKERVILLEFHIHEKKVPISQNNLVKHEETNERIKTLELELKESKVEMRSLLDQLEISNEELLSSNEELISANEELSSINEEVHCINEELNCVNNELNFKIDEVKELHDDLDNILDNIDLGIVFLDNDLKIRWKNPQFENVIKLENRDESIGIEFLATKLNKPELVNFAKDILNLSPPIEIELNEFFGKDYLVRLLPYKKRKQAISGVVATFIDVSKQKKAKHELTKSEVQHRKLIAAITTLTWTTDKDGNFLQINREWEEFTGQNFDEYKGFGWVEAIHPEDRKDLLKVWYKAVKLKSFYTNAARLYNKNSGKYHHFKVYAVPFLDQNGEIKEWFGANIDINSVIETQIDLRKQKEHLELAFDIAQMGTYQHNVITNEFSWDEKMHDIFGKKKGVTNPKKVFYKAIHPDDLNFVKDIISGLFDPVHPPEFEFSYRIIHDKRGVRHLTTKGLITKNKNGKVEGITGVLLDETTKKVANLKLIEKTKELETSNKELEQFAYVTTHDLRAPIINLKQLLKIFKRRNFVNKENAKLFDQMDTSIVELHETLHDLIAIVALKKPLDETVESIDFKEILEKILISIMEMVKEANAELLVDFTKAPKIDYIPGHIKSIVLNLLSNALKYRSEDRDLHIEIKTTPCKDDFVCFSVKDNGIGIDPSQIDKLFGLFQRLRDDREGKGVGLFITKSQVESLGGRLEVDSELGVGSTFKVYLKNSPLERINS